MNKKMKILISKILPHPDQPRRHINQEYIEGLAISIRQEGLKEPITVEDNADGTYTLVKGQCRILASLKNGETVIEADVRKPTNHEGKQRLIDAMIENISRENMTAVDEGNGYKILKEKKGMSVRQISMAIGKNEPIIYAMLAIADMEPEIQEWMNDGKLPHDRKAVDALNSIPDSKTRVALAGKLAARSATIRMVEKACFQYQQIKRETREKKRMERPALEVSGLTDEPPEWDALFQIGRVPPWQRFTESVMQTCDSCSLKPVASESTCRDCPLVIFCQNILEKTK